MTNADGMFAAAREIGEKIAEQRAAQREALRLARNARSRARRAAAPKPKPVPQVSAVGLVGEDDVITECRCHITPYPPCGWCESGGMEMGDAS